MAASCRVRHGFSFERSISTIPLPCTDRRGCGQPVRMVATRGGHHGWRAAVDSCCGSRSRPVKTAKGSAGRIVSGGVLLAGEADSTVCRLARCMASCAALWVGGGVLRSSLPVWIGLGGERATARLRTYLYTKGSQMISMCRWVLCPGSLGRYRVACFSTEPAAVWRPIIRACLPGY